MQDGSIQVHAEEFRVGTAGLNRGVLVDNRVRHVAARACLLGASNRKANPAGGVNLVLGMLPDMYVATLSSRMGRNPWADRE